MRLRCEILLATARVCAARAERPSRCQPSHRSQDGALSERNCTSKRAALGSKETRARRSVPFLLVRLAPLALAVFAVSFTSERDDRSDGAWVVWST